MTTPSFNVNPEQLREHANSLAGYADRLSGIGTRLPDAMGEQSLGAFAQFITAGLGGAMTATLDAFTHAGSTVDKVSSGMRQVADQYQRDDENSSSELAGIESTMGEGVK